MVHTLYWAATLGFRAGAAFDRPLCCSVACSAGVDVVSAVGGRFRSAAEEKAAATKGDGGRPGFPTPSGAFEHVGCARNAVSAAAPPPNPPGIAAAGNPGGTPPQTARVKPARRSAAAGAEPAKKPPREREYGGQDRRSRRRS